MMPYDDWKGRQTSLTRQRFAVWTLSVFKTRTEAVLVNGAGLLQQIIAECHIWHPKSFLRITRPGEFDNHAKVDSSESSLRYKCGEAKPATFRRSSFHFRTHQQLCDVYMPVWRASNPDSHVPRSTLTGKGMHFTTRLSDDCGMAVLQRNSSSLIIDCAAIPCLS